MIAIDSNVLLRYRLGDDPVQSLRADALITGRRPVLVTDVVLVEILWTLRGRKYGLDKDALITVLEALFEEPNICFEDDQVIWAALNDYRESMAIRGRTADFADALVIRKARYTAKRRNTRFDGAYTFDLAAQALPGAKSPG